MTNAEKALQLHEEWNGKFETTPKMKIQTREDLALAYTPGVAEPCKVIAKDKEAAYKYTIKSNTIAVVSDGSAVLGLGNIGAHAAMPVMEGKAVLFKEFGNVNAVPVCLDTQDTEEIIKTVVNIAPAFGGINLEDISAPRCFEIETRLKELLDIPVNMDEIYSKLYNIALTGDTDCGGLLSYNYISGEPVTGFADGRPMFVRSANDKFSLANFMRTHLYASVGVLKIGNDILFKEEKVKVDRITGHGGLFKTKNVGQRVLAAALNSPISVMETAGEGGAWGIALLGSFLVNNEKKQPLDAFLDEQVFGGDAGVEIAPTAEDVAGFNAYIENYKAALPIEEAAVKFKK